MKKALKICCSILVFLALTGCSMFQANLALDTAVIWADAKYLSESYEASEKAFRVNKDKFSEADWAVFEEFDATADYVVTKYNDMAFDQVVTISLEEINMLWNETKEAYLLVRDKAIKNQDKFSRIDWLKLRSFDFKAGQVDANITKLIESENGDATAALSQIASILGMTLKIATIAAAL